MPSNRLLTLSPERLAQEKRFVAWAAQQANDERRRALGAAVVASAWLTAGYCLLFFSVWTPDPEIGALAFWAGLAVGNIGPVATGFQFWGEAGI